MKNLLVASKVRCIVPGVLARDLCRHTDWCNNDSGETRQGTFKCGCFLLLIAEEAFKCHKCPVVTYLEFRRSGVSCWQLLCVKCCNVSPQCVTLSVTGPSLEQVIYGAAIIPWMSPPNTRHSRQSAAAGWTQVIVSPHSSAPVSSWPSDPGIAAVTKLSVVSRLSTRQQCHHQQHYQQQQQQQISKPSHHFRDT